MTDLRSSLADVLLNAAPRLVTDAHRPGLRCLTRHSNIRDNSDDDDDDEDGDYCRCHCYLAARLSLATPSMW